MPSSSSAYPSLAHSSSNAQVRPFVLNLLQRCPKQEASGWLPPSRRDKSKSLGRPDIYPRTSRTGFLRQGKFFPPLGLMRGWFSFPISSADWAFHSTLLSGGSCSIMAWISTIWPRTSSSISRRLSSCARPFSASAPTSASGLRPLTSSPRWCPTPRRSAEELWLAEWTTPSGSRAPFDEDINTIVTSTAPTVTYDGPITRARARQLNYQVLSFLGNDSNVHENMMLPKLDTFVLLTNEGPSLEKDEHWSKNTHGVDGMRKGIKNGVTSDDFRTLKPP